MSVNIACWSNWFWRELYVLDMGEPVKIKQLAEDMIRLNGLEPNVDIKIEYSGLRKGRRCSKNFF